MKYTVYMHTNKINGKKYIGITCREVEDRWREGKGYDRQYFYRAIQKYGWDNFTHEILKTGLTEEEAIAEEIRLIALYDTTNTSKGYNVSLGGEGMTGSRLTEHVRQKTSESHKGKKMPQKTREAIRKANIGNKHSLGKKHSEEAKRKIGEALKGNKYSLGRVLSESHKKRLSGINKGRKHTEESRLKISKSRKGDKNYNARKVICIDTNEIFNTILDCANAYEINKSTLNNWLRGARKCSHKYTFMYYDEYLQKNIIEKAE